MRQAFIAHHGKIYEQKGLTKTLYVLRSGSGKDIGSLEGPRLSLHHQLQCPQNVDSVPSAHEAMLILRNPYDPVLL